MILSAEALQTARPSQLTEWVGDLGQVVVVAYLREPFDWVTSFYQQAVKARLLSDPFEVFAEGFAPDYHAFLRAWEDEVGRAALRPRVYNRERLLHGDVVADFLAVLGLPRDLVPAPEGDANPSIGGALLEAKRRVNGLGLDEATLRGATLRPLFRLAAEQPEYRSRPGADPDFARRYRERVSASNAAVSARYFDGGLLFRLPDPAPDPGPAEAEVREALARLVALVREGDEGVGAEIGRRLEAAGAGTAAAAP